MSLRVKKHFNGEQDSWLFEISGELDLETSANFKDILNKTIDEKMANIIFDCRELTFIDSTGLGIMISIYKRIKEHGHLVSIKNPKKNINKLLNITGLSAVFEVN